MGAGAALHSKDAERSLRDIEASLLVSAQQCALDDEEEVGHCSASRRSSAGSQGMRCQQQCLGLFSVPCMVVVWLVC